MDTTTITIGGTNAAEATISALGIARKDGFDPLRVLGVKPALTQGECFLMDPPVCTAMGHPNPTGRHTASGPGWWEIEIAGWRIPESELRAMDGDR